MGYWLDLICNVCSYTWSAKMDQGDDRCPRCKSRDVMEDDGEEIILVH